MLLRDKVPVRDSCVLRSWWGEQGRGLTPTGPATAPCIPERKWGRGRRELGERVLTSTAQPALPPHPLSLALADWP